MDRDIRQTGIRGLAGILLLSLVLSGCSVVQARRNSEIDAAISAGDYKSAALIAEARLGFKPAADGAWPPVTFQPGGVLNHLDAAEAWRLADDTDRSLQHYDAAEQSLKSIETQGLVSQGAKQIGATLFNDSMLDYVPSPAEAVLINYYKALDFWKKGDLDNTRVELNRSDDRTRRAVERYQDEISKAQTEAEQKKSDQTYSNPAIKTGIDAKFPEMEQWAPYKEFIVPPATYLQALFLARSSDREDHSRGADLFKRVVGVIDSNAAVERDAEEAAQGGACPRNNCLWVLVEHGLGPELKERRIDLPIVTLSGLLTVSFALPALESRTDSDLIPFRVIANGESIEVPPMASMDKVVQVEFQKRFPAVVTRAVVSSTVKAIAQHEINKRAGAMLGLLANAVSAATTSADTRMWRSMPGRWALTRIEKTAGMTLALETGTGPVNVELPADGSALVYVKAPVATAPPMVQVLKI